MGQHHPGRYRAVIFDVDGTLVDSNEAHARAWVDAFAERGFTVALADVRRLIGMGGDKLIPAAIGLAEDDPRIAGLSERRSEIFRTRHLPHLRPVPGSRALLQRLRRDGYKLAVASSAKKEELEPLLRIAHVEDLVTARTSSSDAERSKPDPDIVGAALQRLQLEPGQAVMVGDTPYDIEAAQRAGLPTIAVRSGGWPTEELGGAIAVYDDAGDLLARLEASPLAGQAR
jgi:HAD superfamily hydrolase (TIGR01509 family)